ncbi:MAG: TIR domain-containing protein, partial [Xanthomonadales bacterium]|nr:TIR domain-containing protein [Xanthomonadales bacterium]
QQRPNIPTDDFRSCQLLSISPKTGFGLNTLRGHIEDAVHTELEQHPTIPIGQGRVEVRDQLHEMLDKDQQLPSNERQHRTLSIEAFEHLCRENGKISDASAFLDYLHHCGDVFYREDLFDNQIILDQAWALDAIYTLFHREHALPALNRYGCFTREELSILIWKDYSIAEQQLFLSFMESCGICFKAKRLNPEEYDTEWEYIAPELLPEEADIQSSLAGRMIGQSSETLHAEYNFLHEGILRSLLTKIGQQANDNAVYWKYGCWFIENNTQSQIRIQSQVDTNSGQGQITFTAMGPESCQLIVKVLHLLQEIRVGQTPTLTSTWFNGTRTLNDIHQMSKDTYTNHSSDQENNAKLNVTKHPNIQSTGKPEIYISYAWGEDRTDMGRQREAAVEGIATVAEQCEFNVRLDRRDLRLGDWISNYMKAITNSDRVIVILSEKYLQSEACMTELHGIYQRAVGEKQTFLDRITSVVLDDAKNIGKLEYRVSCAKGWKQRFQQLEPDLDVIGHDGYRLWQQMRLWYTDTADMLGFISDTLHLHGFDDLTKDNYHGIRELLTRKLVDGTQHDV